MEQKGLAAVHGVLIAPEILQPMLNKIIERRERLLSCDRQGEIFEAARIFGELALDQLQHFACGSVGGELWQSRNAASGFAEWFAVVLVEVPGATDRFAAFIEQDPEPAAHKAIKVFQ